MRNIIKKLFIPLIFNCFCTGVNAQYNQDSLWGIWKDVSKPDTIRLSAIQTIAWVGYLNLFPDSAIYFAGLEYEYAAKTNQKKYMAGSLHIMGEASRVIGNYAQALDYYNRCLTIRKEMDDERGAGGTLKNMGNVYLFQANYDKAMECYSASLVIAEKYNDLIGCAGALGNIGMIYEKKADYATAIEYHKRSLLIKREINDQKGIAKSLNNIGIALYNQGYYEQALDYYLQALLINKNMGNTGGISSCLNNIGIIYHYRGDFDKAMDYYKQSLIYDEQLGNKDGIATTCNNLGILYKDQGDNDNALKYLRMSFVIKVEVGDEQGIADYWHNIGTILQDQGDGNIEIECYEKSLKIKEKLGDLRGIAGSLNNIGICYQNKSDYNNALDFYSKGLAIYEEIGDKKGAASSFNNIGGIYQKRGDYNKAISYCLKSYNNAKEIGAPEEIVKAIRNLVPFYCAIDSLNLADPLISELIDIRDTDLKVNFSIFTEQQKELYFITMEDDYELFCDYALLRKNNHPEITDRVFDNALRIKGLLLKSSTAMRNAIFNSNDSLLIQEYEDWIALRRRIAKLFSEGEPIEDLENSANELENELVKKSLEFQDMSKVQTINWRDVQSNLDEGEAAIEFVRFTHHENFRADTIKEKIYCALIVKKGIDHPEMVRLFSEDELKKIVGTFPGNNLSYINQIYGTGENTKTQLYNLIWKPMEESLDGIKKVHLSPVGLLHKISFSAIAKEQDVYLCDIYKIETRSSTSQLAMPQTVDMQSNYSMTLFGGINYNSDSTVKELWPFLEGTKTEADKIINIMSKKRQVSYYTGSEATEEIFKKEAPKSRIVHVATHGFFYPDPNEIEADLESENESGELTFRGGKTGFGVRNFVHNKNPLMRSGIVLAGANDVWCRTQTANENSLYKEDGVLTAQEVATIDMRNTGLVVLSACETGLGDIKGSEGVYGLLRSFKMAGVQTLIISLWQVPDKETAEFMTLFYKNLIKSNDIELSFYKTQQAMRKKYDPYYWAAFVLIF